MTTRRFLLLLVFLPSLAQSARAQPEVELRAAFDALIAAGNYTWSESHVLYLDPTAKRTRPLPTGEGETTVYGYTSANFHRRLVVLHGTQPTF